MRAAPDPAILESGGMCPYAGATLRQQAEGGKRVRRQGHGTRRAAPLALVPAGDAGEVSTDGEPATHGLRKHLLMALLAALAFAFLQLALAQNGSASTGVPCPQTGMETVATDATRYSPGSLVHMSGTGYAAGCDVVVKVTRPDGLVVVGDGSGAFGSDTVSTDLFGNFTYEYQLQSMPAIEGTYVVDVLGAGIDELARPARIECRDLVIPQRVDEKAEVVRLGLRERFFDIGKDLTAMFTGAKTPQDVLTTIDQRRADLAKTAKDPAWAK